MAQAMLFLASDKAKFIAAVTVPVDGGDMASRAPWPVACTFIHSLGLSVALRDWGLGDAIEKDVAAITRRTMTAPHLSNLAVSVEEDLGFTSAGRAEALSAGYLQGLASV